MNPPSRPRLPTIVTVARQAGVHPSTASRALSGDESARASVAPDTQARVLRAAQQLGYRRNRAGANLRTGRAGVIGVIVPRITDIVVALAYEGLDEAARAYGYVTVISNTLDDPQTRQGRVQEILDHGVDAILYSDGHHDDAAPDVATGRVPLLPFLRSSGSLPAVAAVDDRDGGRQVACHLVTLGHHRIGVVAGPAWASTARDRTAGFVHELQRHGVDVSPRAILPSGFDVRSGKHAAQALLALRPPPTAIFAVNDFTAMGVIAAAREQGMAVPEDISVVGFNDIPLAGDLPIPLTTVHSPLAQVGATAAATAIHAIQGVDSPVELLPTVLVTRESTTGPR